MDTKTLKIENYIGKSKKEVSNPELKFEFIGEGDKCNRPITTSW